MGAYKKAVFFALFLLALVHTYTILSVNRVAHFDVAGRNYFDSLGIKRDLNEVCEDGERGGGCAPWGGALVKAKSAATSNKVAPISTGATNVGVTQNQTNRTLTNLHYRSIALVHVGKAGGMTIRYNLARDKKYNSGQKLAVHTHSVFHMWDKNDTAMEEATTFVITLRNPIERVISSYRFSHPDNCIISKDPTVRIPLSRGCVTIKSGLLERPSQIGYILYKQCYPSASIESFAQSTMLPWKYHNLHFQNLTNSEQALCHQMARRLVQGRKMQRIIPHMQCNYEHYATESIWKYPSKEVFAIRTEHAWDDMVQIDLRIGGNGAFKRHGDQYSHGSEHYQPSPVSTEAYHKLCCVLEKEIDIYFQMFDLALNLGAAQKAEAEDELREKCGVTTSWAGWRTTCQKRVAASELEDNVLRPRSDSKRRKQTAAKE